MVNLRVAVATDLGLKRERNEDSHACWIPEDPVERASRGVMVVIADGMGGARAGHVASRIAVETVLEVWRESPPDDPVRRLREALVAANMAVFDESRKSPETGGMGTTCTALAVRGQEAFLAHVGDSRLYHLRDGHITQLTSDHSLVAQMVRDGFLTEDEARRDPRRNVVTRSVGVTPQVDIEAFRAVEDLRPGDTLLLSTDGLHGLVSDEELVAIASDDDLEAACQRLIATANGRGGPDNITVGLVRVVADGPAGRQRAR